MYLRAIIHELLWFISGDTNIKYLVDNNVRIWNEWPYEIFKKSEEYQGETMEEFVGKIKESDEFAKNTEILVQYMVNNGAISLELTKF